MTDVPPPDAFPVGTSRKVVWLALPNGTTGRRPTGLVSVFVSPRLRRAGHLDGTLEQFPEFDPWPGTAVDFVVEIDGEPVEAQRVDAGITDTILWSAILPRTTLVRSHQYDSFAGYPVNSYAASMLNGWFKDAYGKVGSQASLPEVDELLETFVAADVDSTRRGTPDRATIERQLDDLIADHGAVPAAGIATPQHNFALVERFHRRPSVFPGTGRDPGGADGLERLPTPPEIPVLDFHQIISLLGEHPALLRRMGLVIDLQVPIPLQRSGTVAVRVRPRWDPATPGVDVVPLTLTDFEAFRPAPRDPGAPFLPGYLAVGRDGLFDVVNVDLDGSAMKTKEYARELQRRRHVGPAGARLRGEPVPPAIRSAGFQLVRTDRGVGLHQQWLHADDLDQQLEAADDDTLLGAEDLTRGLRPDILEPSSGTWRSLVARKVDYQFTNPDVDASEVSGLLDEGTVTTAASGAEGNPDAGVWIGESLFQWTGWSLAAPRPGKAVTKAEFPGDDGYEERDVFEGDPPFAATAAAAPGELPRLRFGWDYRVRARTVDLAGNSSRERDTGSEPPESTLDAGRYLRFEPIEDPEIVTNAPRTAGEQIGVLVVRTSEFDEDGENTDRCVRGLYPPKTSQAMAELHGRFDVDGEVPLDIGAYASIVARESNTFDTRIVDGVPVPYGTPDPMAPDTRYHEDPPEFAPYLPDPIARAVALRGHRLDDLDAVEWAAFPGSWPELRPVALWLRKGAADVDVEGARITFVLPPGLRRTVHISSAPDEDDIEALGQYQWAIAYPEADAAAIKQRIREGRAPLVTPSRRIELVHALRQPPPPALEDLSAPRRAPGDTAARLTGAVDFLRPAVGRLDVLASWTDPVDRGPGPPPSTRVVEEAVAASIPLNRLTSRGRYPLDDPHELGDTKHHLVTYRPVAASSYTEFFTRTEVLAFTGGALSLPDLGLGVVGESVRLRSVDRATAYQRGTDFTLDPGGSGEPATVATVPGGRLAGADEVEVTWLANPVTRRGPAVEVHVPSSARPPAPSVRAIVPTFGWERQRDEGRTVSRRRGNGLRVFLDRPWWASGDGELLGVVLYRLPALSTSPSAAIAGQTTQWGVDPAVSPGTVHEHPAPHRFPAAPSRGIGTDLPLVEVAGATVDVVGHPVEYDAGRDLYTCDIEIDAGAAYMPFVRLALARYQPESIDGMHLSPVVLADFVQLAPDRTATITHGSLGAVTVRLSGRMYAKRGEGTVNQGFARAIIEYQKYPEAGDAGWVAVGTHALTPPVGSPFLDQWEATFRMPAANGPRRLVIEQGELISTSGDPTFPLFDIPPFGAEERVIYQDIVPYPLTVG